MPLLLKTLSPYNRHCLLLLREWAASVDLAHLYVFDLIVSFEALEQLRHTTLLPSLSPSTGSRMRENKGSGDTRQYPMTLSVPAHKRPETLLIRA
jgi:hypothetical protein